MKYTLWGSAPLRIKSVEHFLVRYKDIVLDVRRWGRAVRGIRGAATLKAVARGAGEWTWRENDGTEMLCTDYVTERANWR